MGKLNQPIMRISRELREEIERISKLNKLKYIEASRDLARFVRQSRNKKRRFYNEVQF